MGESIKGSLLQLGLSAALKCIAPGRVKFLVPLPPPILPRRSLPSSSVTFAWSPAGGGWWGEGLH